jgi:hypothetical protein
LRRSRQNSLKYCGYAPGAKLQPSQTRGNWLAEILALLAADGAPVEGGVVHIPIRLSLKGAAN